MRFIMTVNASKLSESGVMPPAELMAAIGKLTQEIRESGALVTTGGLYPSSKGARMTLSKGKITVTDGPFTETKELIGGFIIVDVKSKEDALELARRFFQIHADILGPSHEMSSEIRQMYTGEER
jgi:hypothetical protein